MTLTTLLLYIGIAAAALTALTHLMLRATRSLPVSLLQNFVGALFVFSGYVKAIDPLGTAYKMEQYFAEFEATAAGAGLEAVAPVFPWLASFSAGFAVFMIVLEIMLGVMLIVGARPKLTAWSFYAITLFFTILTGFTYLTGYVPPGTNFFAFEQWGDYADTNMRVTDCGCFGDFLKLEPYTSFLKDVALLVVAQVLITLPRRMHRIMTPAGRGLMVAGAGIASLIFCLSNFVWDLPGQDFRPFRVGTDIAAVKQAEEEAMAGVQVLGYDLTNKATGETIRMGLQDYMRVYKDYPTDQWEHKQYKSEPAIEATKISEFEASDDEGIDVVPELLAYEGYTFLIVAYTFRGEAGNWNDDYLAAWREDIQPVVERAEAAGHRVAAMTKFIDDATLQEFRAAVGADYPFYRADDILLKTIIRSNPGAVLLHDGVVVDKWHHLKLPAFDELLERDILAAAGE